jgi:hypothetical protein
MRKQDIRAGVAYAYQGSTPRNIEPCVLVSTELHTGRKGYSDDGPWCALALAGVKAGLDRYNGNTGYPALLRSSGISAPRKPDAGTAAAASSSRWAAASSSTPPAWA